MQRLKRKKRERMGIDQIRAEREGGNPEWILEHVERDEGNIETLKMSVTCLPVCL